MTYRIRGSEDCWWIEKRYFYFWWVQCSLPVKTEFDIPYVDVSFFPSQFAAQIALNGFVKLTVAKKLKECNK